MPTCANLIRRGARLTGQTSGPLSRGTRRLAWRLASFRRYITG